MYCLICESFNKNNESSLKFFSVKCCFSIVWRLAMSYLFHSCYSVLFSIVDSYFFKAVLSIWYKFPRCTWVTCSKFLSLGLLWSQGFSFLLAATNDLPPPPNRGRAVSAPPNSQHKLMRKEKMPCFTAQRPEDLTQLSLISLMISFWCLPADLHFTLYFFLHCNCLQGKECLHVCLWTLQLSN